MKHLSGLDQAITGLDGKALENPDGTPVVVKHLLANLLARGSSPDPIRAMKVALDIYQSNGALKLEDADLGMLRKAVEEDKLVNNLAKAAILKVLDGIA